MDTEKRVKHIIANKLRVNKDNVKPHAFVVEDLGANSLDIVELIMMLEDEFKIEIPDEDTQVITTVQSIIDYIDDRI